MDRRLLFPAIAVTALAQQTSPVTSEAEKALRARAEQFYQFEVDGKYRNAEALVAEDSKDYYYANGKPQLKSFRIGKIEFTDETHAVVSLIATVIMVAPALGSMEVPTTALHTWKLENGEWTWYTNTNGAVETPFGKMHPGTAGASGSILPLGFPSIPKPGNALSIDRTSVNLSSGPRSVSITNHLPGAVTLQIGADRPAGIIVEMDKSRLAQEETAVVSFRASGDAKPSGTILITASPVNTEFSVQITQ